MEWNGTGTDKSAHLVLVYAGSGSQGAETQKERNPNMIWDLIYVRNDKWDESIYLFFRLLNLVRWQQCGGFR